jgi:hypothetical protein
MSFDYKLNNKVLITFAKENELQNFIVHKENMRPVLTQLLDKTSSAAQDSPTISKIDFHAWISGGENPEARDRYLDHVKEETLKWVSPLGTERHTIIQEHNRLCPDFTAMRDIFNDYETISSNLIKLVNVDPSLHVKITTIFRETRNCSTLRSLKDYQNILEEVSKLFAEVPLELRDSLLAFSKLSPSHEYFSLVNLETSVFCGLSIIMFATIFYPLHHAGQLTQLLTSVSQSVEQGNINITETKRFIKYKPEPNFLKRTQGFLLSNKRTITWLGGGILSGGVVTYLFKERFTVPMDPSGLEALVPKNWVLMGQKNLEFFTYTLAHTVSKASKAASKGWLEPWLKTINMKEIHRLFLGK